jgi:CRP-like cAMP-binding protein
MTDKAISSFIRRLQLHGNLSERSVEAIHALPWRVMKRPKHSYVLREGDLPQEVSVLVAGFAQRQKHTSTGRRQIVSFSVPGDPLDFDCLYLKEADFGVQMAVNGTIACVRTDAINALLDSEPQVARAVTATLLSDAAVSREWVVNTGRRDARQRIAHVLCEIIIRLNAQNFPTDIFELPFTQEQLGDATGLTPVHVNRILRNLTQERAISRRGRLISVPDWSTLEEIGDFDDRFLHLQGTRTRLFN